MDLSSALGKEDAFLSYWIHGNTLIGAAGDADDVHAIASLEIASEVRQLVYEFRQNVTRASYYGGFLKPAFRDPGWPETRTPGSTLTSLIAQVGELILPDSLASVLLRGKYRRLILCPDGFLHDLPFLVVPVGPRGRTLGEEFRGGVLLVPSMSIFAYCQQKLRQGPLERPIVVVGEKEDSLLVQEGQRIASALGARVVTQRFELERLSEIDLLYVASHGIEEAEGEDHRLSGEWRVEFDGSFLSSQDFFSRKIRLARGAALVVSACSVGHPTVLSSREISGLLHAAMYAGASTLVAATWPILDETADKVLGQAVIEAARGRPFGAALQEAIVGAKNEPNIRRLISSPEAEPFFWGPFVVYGADRYRVS